MRVPCVLGVFVARAALLMLTPEHFLYPVILQYLLIKPQLQITSVPLFSRLVYSSSFKVIVELFSDFTVFQHFL